MMKTYISIALVIVFLKFGNAQIGVFTEFDIEATEEVTDVEGIIMESRFGVLYGLSKGFRLRAGASRLGRRTIYGGYYNKYRNQETQEVSIYESLNLYHTALSTGYSFFGGLEIFRNRFLFGIDVHSVTRHFKNGGIRGNYNYSSFFFDTGTSGININENYNFYSTYSRINYLKANIKLGYAIYSKPRGALSLYLNFSQDLSEDVFLSAADYDLALIEVDDIFTGNQTSGMTLSSFLNSSNLNYQRQSFSVGLNVSYFFNVKVEKTKQLRIGG